MAGVYLCELIFQLGSNDIIYLFHIWHVYVSVYAFVLLTHADVYTCVCVGWRINRSLRMFKQPVFSPCFSHALSRFTGQAVGGLITLRPYVTDWHSAKSGIRIR